MIKCTIYSQHPVTRTLRGNQNLFELTNGIYSIIPFKGNENSFELTGIRDSGC